MRRVIALLVAALLIASSVEAGALVCTPTVPGVTSHHTCCPDGVPMAAPSPATCCAVAQGTGQQGPAEARVDAPALQVISIQPHDVPLGSRTQPLYPDGPPPESAAVPLYLRQLSLLI